MNRTITPPRPIEELEEKIGYRYKDKNLLLTALTHSSYCNENKHGGKALRDNLTKASLQGPVRLPCAKRRCTRWVPSLDWEAT